MKPGESDPAPVQWPATTKIAKTDRPVLLVFLHPRCPCSRATLANLTEWTSRFGQKVDTRVLFVHPQGVDQAWAEKELFQTATANSRVHVMHDATGHEARVFKVKTSGHVLLYDEKNHLVYSGGITPARGHGGDSFGQRSLYQFARAQTIEKKTGPVFGCPLQRPGTMAAETDSCCPPP